MVLIYYVLLLQLLEEDHYFEHLPGLDSKIIAPIFATLDGVSGTTNWLINKFWNPIDFETNNENQSILDNEENGTLLINDEEFKTRCNETNIDNDSSSLNSVNSVFVAN
ncbi:hypothetical protein [Spiroplasma endosymbiont of Cleonymus obscurus]|uniref:hypothetical protein n=1 Tax=Spiroplasma endosymbiont of Cleonymus obscurus TaxID=3066324 RepID=UPI0037DDBFDE